MCHEQYLLAHTIRFLAVYEYRTVGTLFNVLYRNHIYGAYSGYRRGRNLCATGENRFMGQCLPWDTIAY